MEAEAYDSQSAEKPEQATKLFGGIGFWMYDRAADKYWRSTELFRLYEISKNKTPSEDCFQLRIHPEDRSRVFEAKVTIWTKGAYTLTYRLVIGGKIKWIEEHVQVHICNKKNKKYLIGIVQEITSIKNEQLLARQKQLELSAIMNYLSETVNTTDINSIILSAGNTLERIIPVRVVGIFLRENGSFLWFSPGLGENIPVEEKQNDNFLAYHVIEAGRVFSTDIENYPNISVKNTLQRMGAKKVMAMPIFNHGKTIAALSLIQLEKGSLSLNEQAFCSTICGHLSSQLKNALLYRQLERELEGRHRLESDLDTIFHESIDFICLISPDGFFLRVNPIFSYKLCYSENEVLSHSILEFIYPEERERGLDLIHHVLQKSILRGFQLRFASKSGGIVYTEINARYVKASEKIMIIARDVTHLRRIEKEKVDLERSVELEKLKTEFFSNLSHELKTPLHVILSSLELMQVKLNKDNADNKWEYLRLCSYMYQNSMKLLRLTGNLMDSTKIESGLLKADFEKGDIAETLQEIVQSVEPYAVARGLSLSFSTQLYYDSEIAFDRDLMDRILLNLLSNAIKNTQSGGHIRVWADDTPKLVSVYVADDGVGIGEELKPVIFEKFQGANRSLTKHCDGSGLGLSIVKSLVKIHGGEIGVSSKPDCGSTFWFTISRELSVSREQRGSFHTDDSIRKTRLKMEMSEFQK